MYQLLYEKINEISRVINPYLLMLELSKDKEFAQLIVDLNTQSQLYDEGINWKGQKLSDIGGEYAPYTIEQKEKKGQPTDRITLNDTGDFYDSFRVTFIGGDFLITANPYKGDTNLFKEWGLEIVGLTDENMDLVVTVAQKKVIEIIKRNLKLAA